MRDFSSTVARAELAVVTCDNTDAAGLLFGKLAAVSRISYEHVMLTSDMDPQQRIGKLKQVDAGQLVVVRCVEVDCTSIQSIAAGTEMYGVPPTVIESERQTPVLYDGGEWIDRTPLVVIHQQAAQEAL